jgi:hypothetical protein
MLRIPHCLQDPLTDGGKVVSIMHWRHFTPQKHYYAYGTHGVTYLGTKVLIAVVMKSSAGSKKSIKLATCFQDGFLFGLFFHPEDGDDVFIGIVC